MLYWTHSLHDLEEKYQAQFKALVQAPQIPSCLGTGFFSVM